MNPTLYAKNKLQKFELLEKCATSFHVMLPKQNSKLPIHSTKSSSIWNPGDCYMTATDLRILATGNC
jgi:hypothetical protein